MSTEIHGESQVQLPAANLEPIKGLEQGKEGIKTTSSAGTSTVQGIVSQDASTIQKADSGDAVAAGSTAKANPENPVPINPDPNKATMTPAEAQTAQVNGFLCGIYAVALEQLMAAIIKVEMFKSLTDSKMYLQLKSVEKELAETIADKQIEQGKVEMYTSFAKAACAGASAAMSFGGALGAAAYDPRSSTGTAISSLVQSGNSVGGADGLFSNIVQGFSANEKAQIEATITLTQFMQKYMEDMQRRIEEDRSGAEKAIGEIVQMYNQWMNAMYQFTARG